MAEYSLPSTDVIHFLEATLTFNLPLLSLKTQYVLYILAFLFSLLDVVKESLS